MSKKNLNEVRKGNSRMLCFMKNEKGELLTEGKEVIERWREDFRSRPNSEGKELDCVSG